MCHYVAVARGGLVHVLPILQVSAVDFLYQRDFSALFSALSDTELTRNSKSCRVPSDFSNNHCGPGNVAAQTLPLRGEVNRTALPKDAPQSRSLSKLSEVWAVSKTRLGRQPTLPTSNIPSRQFCYPLGYCSAWQR